MEYTILDKSQIPIVWPHIEQWVDTARGVDHSFSTEDIRQLCLSPTYDLWVITDNNQYLGFLVATIIPAPQMRIYYAPWLGGKDLSKWVKTGVEAVKTHARSQNCRAYSFIGRDAWMRLLDLEADYKGTFYFINL